MKNHYLSSRGPITLTGIYCLRGLLGPKDEEGGGQKTCVFAGRKNPSTWLSAFRPGREKWSGMLNSLARHAKLHREADIESMFWT